MNQWQVIYEYCNDHDGADCACVGTAFVTAIPEVPSINLLSGITRITKAKEVVVRSPVSLSQFIGLMLLALGLGGIFGPLIPELRMETAYYAAQANIAFDGAMAPRNSNLPKSAPVIFTPLTTPDGASIAPVNTDFSLIIPKIGVNAPVVANVDPSDPKSYDDALLKGVAHASTSFLPDQNGTVYLFSHSTNYDWFVKDLNAVFYLLKNVGKGDTIVIYYKGRQYTYLVTDKKIVSPSNNNYLYPTAGVHNLILETCWPPGSTTQRLLIFASLLQDPGQSI